MSYRWSQSQPVRTKSLLPPSLSIPCSKSGEVPVETDFTLRSVEGWLELGNPQAALEELGDRRDSEDSRVLWSRVRIARDLGQGIEAVRLGTRLTAREPGNHSAWLLLASVCVVPAHHPDWAIRALRTALVYQPGNIVLLEALASLSKEMEAFDLEAPRTVERTQSAHPLLPGIGGFGSQSTSNSSTP
jgi:hypothetical protein